MSADEGMEMEACLLPINNCEKVQDGEPFQKVSVGCLAPQTDREYTSQDRLLCAHIPAWALVLRRFTDMDNVRFGVHNVPTVEAAPQVFEVPIHPDVSIGDFLEEKNYNMKQWQLEFTSKINTAVFLWDETKTAKEDILLSIFENPVRMSLVSLESVQG